MAKIAVAMERALRQRALRGEPGEASGRVLAGGDDWCVRDVVCTRGPQDLPFEEQHSQVSIAIVVAGTFQYRDATRYGARRELMTPGSLLLGNSGQYFECGHEHGFGDRCISFQYDPGYFERIAADAVGTAKPSFRVLRVPPLRALSLQVSRACAALVVRDTFPPCSPIAQIGWEELSVQLAARALQLSAGFSPDANNAPPGAAANVTKIVRRIERHPDRGFSIGSLARDADLSPYHFLRVFERVTGVTPHQYVLRARLREVAIRLLESPAKILDIALDCGFGDVSNFNRAFRSEFRQSPREYRRRNAE